jgi:hypothetical protein
MMNGKNTTTRSIAGFFEEAHARLNATQRNATQRKFNNIPAVNRLFNSKIHAILMLTFITLFSSRFIYAQNISNLDPTPRVMPP